MLIDGCYAYTSIDPHASRPNATCTAILSAYDGNEIVIVIVQVMLKAQAVERYGTEPSCLQVEKRAEHLVHMTMDGKMLRGTCKQATMEYPSVHFLLRYRRDVSLGVEASRVPMAGTSQAQAALNGGVLALMDWLHVRNVASQMRRFCARPRDALQWLCGALIR